MTACLGWLGCATGSEGLFEGVGGAGGAGGSDATTSTTSATTGSTTSATTGATTSSSTSTSATTTSSTTGGGPDCDVDEHLCGGVCVGNTPQTGCFESSTCAPCPVPPAQGVATCTAAGACDFTCNAPYQKNGNACSCPNECCSAADCGGAACVNGSCQSVCDDLECFLECFQMFCPGACAGGVCQCAC